MDEHSLIGTVFAGRFFLQAVLGKGGMGTVFLGRDTSGELPSVAIKVLDPSLSEDRSAAARFRREARAASRIDHPNVVRVYFGGETEQGLLYLVMERVAGSTLATCLAREWPLPLGRTLQILIQIADALEAAHACQVVHRDIKTQNVLLTRQGPARDLVKVMDFGLARLISPGVSTLSLSRDGRALGTPAFMSPEQCRGVAVDHRSDIYSLGVLAFELLTGSLPFSGSMVQIVNSHLCEEPRPPSIVSRRAEIGPRLDHVVLRCLAKRPEERYASAGELRGELEDILVRLARRRLTTGS